MAFLGMLLGAIGVISLLAALAFDQQPLESSLGQLQRAAAYGLCSLIANCSADQLAQQPALLPGSLRPLLQGYWARAGHRWRETALRYDFPDDHAVLVRWVARFVTAGMHNAVLALVLAGLEAFQAVDMLGDEAAAVIVQHVCLCQTGHDLMELAVFFMGLPQIRPMLRAMTMECSWKFFKEILPHHMLSFVVMPLNRAGITATPLCKDMIFLIFAEASMTIGCSFLLKAMTRAGPIVTGIVTLQFLAVLYVRAIKWSLTFAESFSMVASRPDSVWLLPLFMLCMTSFSLFNARKLHGQVHGLRRLCSRARARIQ